MRKLVALLLVGVGCFFGSAQAQNCSAYSYTLTNGTTADASQVMSNFNNILSCANNNLAALSGATFTGIVTFDPPGNAPMALNVQGNGNGVLPPTGWGGGFGVNYTAGQGETDLWNLYTPATTAFQFRQRTASSGTLIMTMMAAGQVGIGNSAPQATLDVSGFARLALNSSAPATCSSTNEGAVALTHLAQVCVCDTTPAWHVLNTGTACSW